jgi:hypothetical protein
MWTLSFPRSVRFALARSPQLLGQVVRAFVRAVFAHLRRGARKRGVVQGQPAAVVFVQRFGSFANLNVHLHVCFADGVFAQDGDGRIRFRAIEPPTDAEVESVAHKVVRRVAKLLERHQTDAECDDLDDALAAAQAVAVHAVPTHSAASQRHPRSSPRPRSAFLDGFSLHADTAIHRNDRVGLERVLRYSGRPALAHDRLALDDQGRVTYRFRRPSPSGKLSLSIAPVDFLARLATLIPPPRQNQVRYHGVFSANHKWRALVVARIPCEPGRANAVPADPPNDSLPLADASGANAPCSSFPPTAATSLIPSDGAGLSHRRLDWAALLTRVFGPDVTRCPRCPGNLGVIAFVTRPDLVLGILSHLG